MKKAIKQIISITFGIILVSGFIALIIVGGGSGMFEPDGGESYPNRKAFSTKYTIEQHKERITRCFNAVNDSYPEHFKIIDFYVDIVYSFKNEPEFWVVEYTTSSVDPETGIPEKNGNKETTVVMGYIANEVYYKINTNDYLCHGYSCYRKKGYINNKKYFGKVHYPLKHVDFRAYNSKFFSICAVEVNGEIIGICGELENKVIDANMYDELDFIRVTNKYKIFSEEEITKCCNSIKPREEPLFFSPMVDYSLTVDTIEQYLEKRRLSDRSYIIDDLYDKKGNQIYKLVEFEDDGYMIFDVSGFNPVLKDFSPNTASPYKKYEQENGEITSKKIYDPSDMLKRSKWGAVQDLLDYTYDYAGLSDPHVLNYRSSWGYVTGRRIRVISSEGTTTPFFWPEEKNTLIVFREVE